VFFGVFVGFFEAVGTGVLVTNLVVVGENVIVGIGDGVIGVAVLVGVLVALGVLVGVLVGVSEGVNVNVGVGVFVGVGVSVGVGVGVSVGVGVKVSANPGLVIPTLGVLLYANCVALILIGPVNGARKGVIGLKSTSKCAANGASANTLSHNSPKSGSGHPFLPPATGVVA